MLGLNHLHELGIMHHGIKPHRILVTATGYCLVAEYGGARFMGEDRVLPITTVAYAASELLMLVADG